VRQAYRLNTPLVVHRPDRRGGKVTELTDAKLFAAKSFLQVDAPNVMVTTVKLREDDDSWIVRLYDWEGKKSDVTLTFPFEVGLAEVTGIMEDPGPPVTPNGKTVTIPVGAYAIETVRVVPKR